VFITVKEIKEPFNLKIQVTWGFMPHYLVNSPKGLEWSQCLPHQGRGSEKRLRLLDPNDRLRVTPYTSLSFDLNLWTYTTTFIKFRILSYYYTSLSLLLDLFTYHIQNTLQEQKVFYYTTLHSLST